MSAPRCSHCHSPLAAAEQVCPACGKAAPSFRAAGPRATGRIRCPGRLLLLGLAALLLAGPLAGFLALRSARQTAQADQQTATALAAGTPAASLTPAPGTVVPIEPQHKALRVHAVEWPKTIDPHRAFSSEELSLSALLYERLTRVDAQGTVVPAAAEGWEFSPGADVITFTLRANLTYADGEPLTAEHFAYALRRALSPAIAGELQYVLFDIAGAAELASTPLTDTAALGSAVSALGISTPDPLTLVIRLKAPAAHFPAIMSQPIAAPFRAELLVNGGAERLWVEDRPWGEVRERYVGNGPFMLGEVERDQRVQLVPNPRYWGGRPRLSALDYIYITDPDVALDAYRHGELDIVRVTTPQLGLADDEAALRQDLVAYPKPFTRMLSFNLTKPPFDDVHVRRAFAYAFDPKTWCREIRNGDCLPARSWVPPGIAGASEEQAYAFDPEAARAELALSRYAGAMPEISFWYNEENPASKPRAEWIEAELEQRLGVEVKLEPFDGHALGSMASMGRDIWDMAAMTFGGWIGDYPDAQSWLPTNWHSRSKPAREVGYANPALDELLDRADRELDAATRTGLYVEAGKLLAEDVPAIFTDHEANFYLVKPYVTGYMTSPEDRVWPGEASSPLTIDVTRAVVAPPVEPSPSFEPAPTPGPTEPHDAFAPTSTPALVQPALTPTAAADDPDLSPSPIRVPTYVMPPLAPVRPPADGVLRVHQPFFPLTLDPLHASYEHEISAVALLYEGLTRINEQGEVVPGAAERWEVSADGSLVTFTLRPGLTYSDGAPLTAADYERAIRRVLAPVPPDAYGSEFQYLLFDIAGAEQLATTPVTDTAALRAAEQALGVSSPDPRTLVFQLRGPGLHFPSIMSLWLVAPVREDVVARGPDWHLDPRNHVGNGPFVLARIEQDQRLLFRPNPRYWGGQPRAAGIDYVYIEHEEEALRAYQEGLIDIMAAPLDGELERDAALQSQLVRYPQLLTVSFPFNLTKPPFDDIEVRRAFAYAFDAATWCHDVVRSTCFPARGWLPPGVPGASEGWTYAFDPEKARAALAQSSYGGPAGLPPIALRGRTGESWTQPAMRWFVAEIKRHLGISIELDISDSSCLTAPPLTSEYLPQISYSSLGGGCSFWPDPSWLGDYLDPHDWLDARWTCAGETASVMGYCNPALDELIAAAERELDPARRLELYAQAEQLLLDDAPALFSHHGAGVFLVKPYVTGYAPTPMDVSWPGQSASQLTIGVDR